MEMTAFIFIVISIFLIAAVLWTAVKRYGRPSIGITVFLLILLGAIAILRLKYYTTSNAIFFAYATIILIVLIVGGVIQIKNVQKDKRKIIGLFVTVPIYLIGYLGIIINPLFLPADITIENPLKVNLNNTFSLNFIFTHNKYSIMKLLPNGGRSLGIEDNNFSVYSEPSGLKREPPYGFLNFFTIDKKYIKGSIFTFTPRLINRNSFDITVDYIEGQGPIFVNKKAIFQCNRTNPDTKLISEFTFICIKK